MKKIMTILLTLILTLTVITPVLAVDCADGDWECMLREVVRLQGEINDLQRLNSDLIWELANAGQEPPPPPPPPPTIPRANTPNPRLQSPQNITVTAGETVEFDILIRNIGSGVANNFLSQATPSAGAPFTVEFLNNSNMVGFINTNRTHTMRIRITVNREAESGNHSIAFNNLFRDSNDDNESTTDTLSVRVVGADDGAANVRLSNFRMAGASNVVGAGESFVISANVQNIGAAIARDVQVLPQGLGTSGIFFAGDVPSFATMEAGYSGVVNFTFQTSADITSGSHSIEFYVTHRDGSGTFPFFVNVYAPEDDSLANFEIRNMVVPTGVFNVDQTATISFYVYNVGDVEARNIRVESAAENPTAIVPVQTASTQTIASLAPGESHRLTFSFSPRSAATTRSYAIGFTVRYGEDSFEQFAAINVFNPEAEDDEEGSRTQIPRVIIANTILNPTTPRAGHEFEMEVTFRNTSATRSVNNVRILMEEVIGTTQQGQTPQFAGFTPLGGSNTLFIDYIGPRQEITMNLRFTTVMEATPGSHNMRFSFDYQDEDFYTHEATEQIAIPVTQVSRLEISNVELAESGMVGMSVWFQYRIINSGRVNLINVRTRTEGPFDVALAGRYIGQINAQRTADFNGQFTPLEPGEHRGSFIVYGEDPAGEIVELVHEFVIFVEGGFSDDYSGNWAEGGGMGDMGMMRPGGDMGMGDAWCPVAEEMVTTGYWSEETHEWVSLGEWCPETGAWLPHGSDGFDFMGFIRRPVVWIVGGGIILAAAVVSVVLIRRKRDDFDLDED